MSPTLLELVIAIVIVITAWQMGVALTPWLLRWWRGLWRELDVAPQPDAPSDSTDLTTAEQTSISKEHHNGS